MGKDVTRTLGDGSTTTEVTITVAEYLRLLESDGELDALRAAGVDNWDGYGEVDFGSVEDHLAGARAVLGVAE